MTEQKTIVAARPECMNGQLVVLVIFEDGDWTYWTAESHKDVQAIVDLVGCTLEIETPIREAISATLH
jgi:VCBS repeat-containing protein